MEKNEQRGIYNVTFNDKKATPIKTDLEMIEDAVISEVVMYVKGWQDTRKNRGVGAEHIKLHLDKNAEGYITIEELLNLGKFIRNYTEIFKEPFIDEKGGKVYEMQNHEGVRYRAVIDKQRGGPQLPLTPSDKQIITFYSDRNLKERMQFKNPEVREYYGNLKPRKAKSVGIAKDSKQR